MILHSGEGCLLDALLSAQNDCLMLATIILISQARKLKLMKDRAGIGSQSPKPILSCPELLTVLSVAFMLRCCSKMHPTEHKSSQKVCS